MFLAFIVVLLCAHIRYKRVLRGLDSSMAMVRAVTLMMPKHIQQAICEPARSRRTLLEVPQFPFTLRDMQVAGHHHDHEVMK